MAEFAIEQEMPALHVSRSAERALALLDVVVTSGSISLSEAASATHMPSSTALRHLRAMVAGGWLARNELGQFSGGPTLLRIALGAFRAGPYARLTAAAQPHLERLVDATEESAYIAVRDGESAVYIATVESPRAIRHVGWVGRSAPLEGTAIGRALGAHPMPPGTSPPTEMNTGAFEPDVTAICAPIHGSSHVLAAVTVLGPADRLRGGRLTRAKAAIATVARDLSLDLYAPRDGASP